MNNTKQEELKNFVNNLGFVNQSCLIDEMLTKEIFNFDDIINACEPCCQKCGEVLEKFYDEILNKDAFKCENCKVTDDNPDDQLKDIMEWYLCDSWMIKQLEKQGEPVLKTDFGDWWGRTCTGQAILLDSVIEKIYDSIN